ncbi:MAG: glycosyltransferase family A protein [Elusimicrobiota bacterium]|nr:glycosyltransferase family A protein [Elusimicrobiota bacterium]
MAPRPPVVSVVVPTRDQRPLLAAALASVRAQTFRDYEVLLVDDASSDDTWAWARRQRWPALRARRLSRRKGTPGARNEALARARGRFVAFLDHDDLWAPDYLEEMLGALRDPRVMMACSNVDLVDGRGRVLLAKAIGSSGRVDRVLRAATGLSHTPCMSACVFRRRVFRELGGLDEGFETLDDLDLFHRVGARWGPRAIVFRDRALASYRLHAGQQTAVYGDVRDPAKVIAAFLAAPAADARRRACLLDAAYLFVKHGRRLLRASRG